MREEETSLCGVRVSLPAVGKESISCQKVLPAQISYWSSRNFNSYNISGVFQSMCFVVKDWIIGDQILNLQFTIVVCDISKIVDLDFLSLILVLLNSEMEICGFS